MGVKAKANKEARESQGEKIGLHNLSSAPGSTN